MQKGPAEVTGPCRRWDVTGSAWESQEVHQLLTWAAEVSGASTNHTGRRHWCRDQSSKRYLPENLSPLTDPNPPPQQYNMYHLRKDPEGTTEDENVWDWASDSREIEQVKYLCLNYNWSKVWTQFYISLVTLWGGDLRDRGPCYLEGRTE